MNTAIFLIFRLRWFNTLSFGLLLTYLATFSLRAADIKTCESSRPSDNLPEDIIALIAPALFDISEGEILLFATKLVEENLWDVLGQQSAQKSALDLQRELLKKFTNDELTIRVRHMALSMFFMVNKYMNQLPQKNIIFWTNISKNIKSPTKIPEFEKQWSSIIEARRFSLAQRMLGLFGDLSQIEYARLFYSAAAIGNSEMVRLFLSLGANPDTICDAPILYWASQKGFLPVVKLLIDKKANLEIKYRNYTPLYIASKMGHLDIVKYLVENGANIEAAEGDGSTALTVAAQQGHDQILAFLVEKGAKPIEWNDRTPIQDTVEFNKAKCLQILCKAFPELIDKTTSKVAKTALHMACEKGLNLLAEILLDHKASLEK